MNGTAVVTGASSGIGKVYADRLARRGHDLILIARRENLLTEYARVLESSYAVVVKTIAADLSQDEELARIESVFGRDESISLLVNNAGTATLAPSMAIEPNARQAMTDLNVTALVSPLRHSPALRREIGEHSSMSDQLLDSIHCP
jgi:short-subunit dehydrogenase